jgi:hypothetical protein
MGPGSQLEALCVNQILRFLSTVFFTVVPCILMPSKFFIYQLIRIRAVPKILRSLYKAFIADLIKYAATPPNQPRRCILTNYFNNHNFSKAQIIRSLMMVIKPKHVGAVLI